MMENFNFIPALPEIFLVCMTCVVLLADLFFGQKTKLITYSLAQLSLLATLGLVIWLFSYPVTITFSKSFIWDPIAGLIKVFILLITVFAFVYARNYIEERKIPVGEYYILGLFSVLGMMILVSAYSFLTLYLGVELFSLPLYAMVAIQRDSATGTEAAMKYFVTGSLASAMLLYGMSVIYGGLHSISIQEVALLINATPSLQQLIVIFGLVFLIAGVAFKLGGAPFHMWIPDVYQGAPTSVTLFVGSAPKIAVLAMAFRLFADSFAHMNFQWQQIFIVIAILSIAIGNLVAIVQSNIKRMLSYSAIAHIGYMLLGLLAATRIGYSAALFYIIAYAIMSTGAFGILVVLSKSGIEVENINDLRGLNARNPWLAFMMLLLMFSMAGIPPTVGFFAKLGVLDALIRGHMVWLATLALVFAIVGAYYYLNVVKVMYFEEPAEKSSISTPLDSQIAISINGLVVLFLGVFPGVLLNFCRTAFGLTLSV